MNKTKKTPYIELEPELSACIETKAKREYQKNLSRLLNKGNNKGFQEKSELLRLFLESTDFGKLRSQYEQYLAQGKKVKFILQLANGKPEYKMQVI